MLFLFYSNYAGEEEEERVVEKTSRSERYDRDRLSSKSRFPREKKSEAPRGRRGPSYTFHRRGPWGPITGATSSLAILPQIATLKRGTAPVSAPGETSSRSIARSVHRLRLATSLLQLGPAPRPLLPFSSILPIFLFPPPFLFSFSLVASKRARLPFFLCGPRVIP